jgi:His-Xaa-Ser system protein HxsD
LIDPTYAPSPVSAGPGNLDSEVIRYRVDTALYSREAVFRACYQFTDRCFLFLEPADAAIVVEFRKRSPSAHLADIVGSFANELINQKVRADIARETQGIRELIVAQAFSGADFRDRLS